MKVSGRNYRSIWRCADGRSVEIIDQTLLPHAFRTRNVRTLDGAAEAIRAMRVRGAPLIGAMAAYGVCFAMLEDASYAALDRAYEALIETRPTAVNLKWALDRMRSVLSRTLPAERAVEAFREAAAICDEDVATNEAIGEHGLDILREAWDAKGRPERLNVLTHCNAGWLATVDWGTALAVVYKAHDAGVPVHVWVDETRPRNQGAALTAWELGNHGVPHRVIVDNAGGHLMQRGLVDLCIVGADRVTATGDVANKIGTYLKALAARDCGVPFYVAAPLSTVDWTVADGIAGIPIEERDPDEVSTITGRTQSGDVCTVDLLPEGSEAANYAFDVTPARYVSGLITEKGVCAASEAGLGSLLATGAARRSA